MTLVMVESGMIAPCCVGISGPSQDDNRGTIRSDHGLSELSPVTVAEAHLGPEMEVGGGHASVCGLRVVSSRGGVIAQAHTARIIQGTVRGAETGSVPGSV